MSEQSVEQAIVRALTDVTRELTEIRRNEADARDALRRAIDEQFTALRQDNYGSIMHLADTVSGLEKRVSSADAASVQWRQGELLARQSGQSFYRLVAWAWLGLAGGAVLFGLAQLVRALGA